MKAVCNLHVFNLAPLVMLMYRITISSLNQRARTLNFHHDSILCFNLDLRIEKLWEPVSRGTSALCQSLICELVVGRGRASESCKWIRWIEHVGVVLDSTMKTMAGRETTCAAWTQDSQSETASLELLHTLEEDNTPLGGWRSSTYPTEWEIQYSCTFWSCYNPFRENLLPAFRLSCECVVLLTPALQHLAFYMAAWWAVSERLQDLCRKCQMYNLARV